MRRISVNIAVALLLAWAPASVLAQVQTLDTRVLGGLSVQRDATPQNPCLSNSFTIAAMAWPSAAILAHIHAKIIPEAFDCPVTIVAGDPEATISSMTTTRQPALAPEIWASHHADLWNGALGAQSVRAAGETFSGGPFEAWFVPRYVQQDNPGLTSAARLNDHWRVFAQPGLSQAELLSCPPDWACAMTTPKMVGAYGLGDRFEAVEMFDRFTLDRTLTDKVAQREPVLAYYWQPNALIDRLDLVPLDMGAFDLGNAQCMALENCMPFGASSYAPETVVIAAAEWVFTEAPDIAAYLGRASMPLEVMNGLLAWQAEHEASAEETAAHFIATRRDLWASWQGAAGANGQAEEASDIGR